MNNNQINNNKINKKDDNTSSKKTNINNNYNTLEFNRIKEKLKEFTHSDTVKDEIDNLKAFLSEDECLRKIRETTASRKIVDSLGLPPLPYSNNVINIIELCDKGDVPTPEQLIIVQTFADSCGKMVKYLERSEYLDIRISSFGKSMSDLSFIKDEIGRCIRNDEVDSRASDMLSKLRSEIEKAESDVRTKAESMLRRNPKWFSENYVSKRNGHYVLPVKKQFKSQFSGSVIETSGSGGTYFMEPSSVGKLQSELEDMRMREEDEVRRILYELSALICDHEFEIKRNIDMTDQLDLIFAKGRLSQAMDGTEPKISTNRQIKINKGRHPLLDPEQCVPLDFIMDENISGVIITGPNTGGKTVALKTVGLLSLMAQCGLHIPADEGSILTMHSSYMCDIGDNQSISENLSTFSAHMTNIIRILKDVDSESLVIMDELGSGTDPAEGMGIAMAVLEELRRSGCMFLVSTHYPQVKDYSQNTQGILSARMAFDKDTLTPLYKLEMGETGDSCALHIAKDLGLPQRILDEAHEFTYGHEADAGKDLSDSKELLNKNKSKIIKAKPVEDQTEKPYGFKQGDSVKISPGNETGIVYEPTNKMGEICIFIKGEKKMYNHKRVKLNIPAESLYPEGYDMSIIFDSVENRKARNKLDKGNPVGVIEYE